MNSVNSEQSGIVYVYTENEMKGNMFSFFLFPENAIKFHLMNKLLLFIIIEFTHFDKRDNDLRCILVK